MSERPKILYKYLSYNEDNKGSEAVLSNCTIKFTKPNNFNDPFDCKAIDISHWNKDDWICFFKIRFIKNYPDNNSLEIENCATKCAEKAVNEKLTSNDFLEFVNDFGVLCLSEINDDILMWSHYADCHKGFCAGFYVDNNDNSFFDEINRVNYETIYPKLSSSACPEETAKTIMLTKSCHWRYEHEWRKIKCLVLPQHGILSEIQPYPEKLLASVIFGAKMPQQSRKKLLDIIDKKAVKPEIFEAKLCEHRFSLEISPFIHV